MARKRRNYHPRAYIPVRQVVDPETNEVLGTVLEGEPDPARQPKPELKAVSIDPARAARNKADREYAERIFNLSPGEQLAGAQAALETMERIALRAILRNPEV